MARRCTLCGLEKDSGAGKTAFVCDGCLGLEGRRVVDVMRAFAASPQDLTAFLSQQYRVPTIDLGKFEVADEVRALVPLSLCEELTVMPVSVAGRSLIVAVTDPADI